MTFGEVLLWIARHGGLIALVATWIGIAIVYFRRRSAWGQKQFPDLVNFSLNYVVGRSLVMRTLAEMPAKDVWLNEYGIKHVMLAARRTTPEQPFILLDDPEDMAFIYRAVKNKLSERFASVFVAQSLGGAVQTGDFLFAVTYERYEDMRTLKFRVLIIEEETFDRLFGPEGRGEQLEVPHPVYRARINTLKAMYQMHAKGQETGKRLLDRLQLGMIAATQPQATHALA